MRKCLVLYYLLRRIGSNLHAISLRGAPSSSCVIKFYHRNTFLCKWNLLHRSMPGQNLMRMILIYTISGRLCMFNVAPLVKIIRLRNQILIYFVFIQAIWSGVDRENGRITPIKWRTTAGKWISYQSVCPILYWAFIIHI